VPNPVNLPPTFAADVDASISKNPEETVEKADISGDKTGNKASTKPHKEKKEKKEKKGKKGKKEDKATERKNKNTSPLTPEKTPSKKEDAKNSGDNSFVRGAIKEAKAKIKIFAISGKDLVSKDMNGKSDPYLLLFYNGQKLQSKTVKKTLSPDWNEEFTFVFQPDASLIVQCWDWDFLGKHDFMGELMVPPVTLSSDKSSTEWYTLGTRTVDKKGKALTPRISGKKVKRITGAIKIEVS